MKKGISKIYLSSLVILLLFGSINGKLKAQGVTDVLRYSLQYPSSDPITMVMPGVAYASGFGAYQENPAVMALFDESYFSAGLSNLYVSEKGTYLNNTTTFDVNTLGISHAGILYKVPTSRGSLVVGGGYSLTRGFNRALSGFGFNAVSSITDYYASLPIKYVDINEDTNYLVDAAFDAFAIDYTFDKNNNVTGLNSILRFPNFLGITQSFEVTKTGTLGEYSAFIATELFKNLLVGVSIGALVGNYEYTREFLESDERGLYNGAFIDTDGDGVPDTDVESILSEKTVKENATGFSARLGLVYTLSPNVNIGASYQFRNVLFIERTTDVVITTTMDNGVFYSGDANTFYKYQVTRPARLNVGFSLTNVAGFNFSAMVERVDYSSASIEFDELAFSAAEAAINRRIENNLQEVYNLRFGLGYAFSDRYTARVGYGYYPSPIEEGNFAENINPDRQLFSGGISAMVTNGIKLNIGARYTTWEDETLLYTSPAAGVSADVQEQVHRWNIIGGLTFYF